MQAWPTTLHNPLVPGMGAQVPLAQLPVQQLLFCEHPPSLSTQC
ncbi:MAG TPA: hypothetical protein VE782_15570 [Myxococcaceae bacterium]|nr:hypothetical protein [Myxococcaceae bacterium]